MIARGRIRCPEIKRCKAATTSSEEDLCPEISDHHAQVPLEAVASEIGEQLSFRIGCPDDARAINESERRTFLRQVLDGSECWIHWWIRIAEGTNVVATETGPCALRS